MSAENLSNHNLQQYICQVFLTHLQKNMLLHINAHLLRLTAYISLHTENACYLFQSLLDKGDKVENHIILTMLNLLSVVMNRVHLSTLHLCVL